MAKKHNSEIILRGLLSGFRLDHDGFTWLLDENYDLCVLSKEIRTGREVLLKVDISLGGFIRMCQQVSEEELVDFSMNIVLNEVK